MKRTTTILAVLAILAVAAVVACVTMKGTPEPTEPTEPTGSAAKTPRPARSPAPATSPSPTPAVVDDQALPLVSIRTNRGTIQIELFEDEAPNTVANFVSLVEKGFYSGLTFHRVIPGFMAQGGCPRGTGRGGPGYTFPDEFSAKRRHVRGALSMANSGPSTNGSQFFICYTSPSHLDGKHSVFGRVLGDGMNVVDQLRNGDKMLEVRVERKRNHPYQPKNTRPRRR